MSALGLGWYNGEGGVLTDAVRYEHARVRRYALHVTGEREQEARGPIPAALTVDMSITVKCEEATGDRTDQPMCEVQPNLVPDEPSAEDVRDEVDRADVRPTVLVPRHEPYPSGDRQ